MKTCFNSKIRITQYFGNDFYTDGKKIISIEDYAKLSIQEKKKYKLYYRSMGIKGHDGIDIKPTNNNEIPNIYNFFGGIVVLKEYHNIYGNRIAIWIKVKFFQVIVIFNK